MRQNMMVAVVGIVALSMGGCGLFGGDDDVAEQPSPVPSVAQTAKPSPSPFASKPLVAQQPANTAAPSGLLQSTNPDVRVRQVQRGRKDPFSVIPVRPVVTVSPPPPGSAPVPVPRLPQIPTPTGSNPRGGGNPTAPRRNVLPRPQSPIASRPTTSNRPGTASNRPGATSNRPGSTPLSPLAKRPNFIPSLPKLPDPTLARGVEVTGVVEVGGVPQALVKAPNEPYSRYIKAGQRISNGQVLVKRIEMNGGTPTVILEQYGIEVAKRVGEKPAGATPGTEGAPTASLPVNRLSVPEA